MTDSSSFTSLFALVDSHLSKCKLHSSPSEDSRIRSLPRGLSHSGLVSLPQRLPIPSFSLSENPIANVLSKQLSNMFQAEELKKQQKIEQEKLQEEMRRMALEEENCVIDLMNAVQKPGQVKPQYEKETLSGNSSFQSLGDYKDFISNSPITTTSDEVLLPPNHEPMLLTTDVSYILMQKIKRGKCSAFGKVLTSRLRPVAAPYLRERVPTKIIPFDFTTKSPCDLIKEKLQRKPIHTVCNTYQDFLSDY